MGRIPPGGYRSPGWKADFASGYITRMSNPATMLQFDWEEVEGAALVAVMAKGEQRLNDGALVCEEIAFMLEERAVILRVNPDTDEIIVSLEGSEISMLDWRPLDQLGEIVSRTLGWCWEGRNYRGYLDTFTLALDGIDPEYCFVGAASTLQCVRLKPVAA